MRSRKGSGLAERRRSRRFRDGHWDRQPRAILPLPRGSRLVLISDFAQLHEQDLPVLMRLASHHSLLAVQVMDSAEINLPNVGMMRFLDGGSGRMRWLDTASQQVRKVFQHEAQALHQRQRKLFERIGVPLHRCTTEDDIYGLFIRVMTHE